MFHIAPSLLVVIVIATAGLLVIDLSVVWTVFAVTLVVTLIVAIKRTIPRREL